MAVRVRYGEPDRLLLEGSESDLEELYVTLTEPRDLQYETDVPVVPATPFDRWLATIVFTVGPGRAFFNVVGESLIVSGSPTDLATLGRNFGYASRPDQLGVEQRFGWFESADAFLHPDSIGLLVRQTEN